MFVDTHCHLNMIVKKEWDLPLSEEQFLIIDAILKSSTNKGVEKIITIGSSGLADTIDLINLAKKFKNVFASVGFHPNDCLSQDWKKSFEVVKKLAKEKEKNKIVAIGETGLDFYHKPFYQDLQVDALRAHIELALENNLALVFHSRQSSEEFLKVLEEYKKEIKGVLHCFSHEKFVADTVLSWGLFIGLDAPISYPKNQALRDIVSTVPVEKILLETDAPFLPPQEFRGKQNLPEYIPMFAKTIADLKGIDLEELGKITTVNAQKLFGI
jgi:TatD DNase family protein